MAVEIRQTAGGLPEGLAGIPSSFEVRSRLELELVDDGLVGPTVLKFPSNRATRRIMTARTKADPSDGRNGTTCRRGSFSPPWMVMRSWEGRQPMSGISRLGRRRAVWMWPSFGTLEWIRVSRALVQGERCSSPQQCGCANRIVCVCRPKPRTFPLAGSMQEWDVASEHSTGSPTGRMRR